MSEESSEEQSKAKDDAAQRDWIPVYLYKCIRCKTIVEAEYDPVCPKCSIKPRNNL